MVLALMRLPAEKLHNGIQEGAFHGMHRYISSRKPLV